jgi:phosphoglycolate phosphatase-like HAD superfamily hydrolase
MFDREEIEAVLFDLDGTLMDTDDQAVERLARRLRRLHWPRPHQAARRFVMASETPGNAMMTLLDMLGLDGPLMALNGRLRRWRGEHTGGDFPLVADARDMLGALSGRYRLAVVTTRSLAEAEAFLESHGLRSVFDPLVTRESTWRLKPHPAPIRHAARLLGTRVERCVMVGDTTVDVRAARRAGAWAVGVLCGFGERGELERAGAHVILEHTAHLSSLLG